MLETEHLALRPFVSNDGGALQEYALYKQQTGFEAFNPWPTDAAGCRELALYFSKHPHAWAVCRKSDHQLIGFILFNGIDSENHLDLGHGFLPRYSTDELAQEALERIIQYAFDTLEIAAIDARNEKEWTQQVAPLRHIGFVELPDRMQMTRQAWVQR